METKETLMKKMSDCVFEMEDEEVVDVVKEYIACGYDPQEGMLGGLVDGMKRASELYEEGEYFVPELIVCSDAMYAGIEEFQKYLPEAANTSIGKIAIGVVEGDTHDIGKNLVKIMMETAGFEMIDLGRDVELQKFVDTAKEEHASLVCLSTLMTTTMGGMETVIHLLEEAGIRNQVKVMIGGGPISQKYADKIGADGYSQNAVEAVKLAKRLLNIA